MQRLLESYESIVNALDRFSQGSPALGLVVMAVGIVLLMAGGHTLVVGAASLARRLGISPIIVGLTIVAAGTSAPELVLNLAAALDGVTDLCFGNIVGSNIANIGLVLGVGGLIAPLVVARRVVSTEIPWVIGASVLLVVLLLVSEPGQPAGVHAVGRVGGFIFLTIFTGLLLAWIIVARRGELPPEAESVPSASVPAAILALLAGIVLLPIGGECARSGAVGIALSFGVPEVIIGLTIVAIATSLPELATTVACCLRGQTDIALGNVVGSNLFNILLVLGLTSLVKPIEVPAGGWIDIAVMLGLACALYPLARTGGTLHRWEAAALLGSYVVYLTYLTLRSVL